MEEARQTKSNEQKEDDIWAEQRKKLKPYAFLKDYSFNEHWEAAIEIFEKRIKNKFFEPLTIIQNEGNDEGSGF